MNFRLRLLDKWWYPEFLTAHLSAIPQGIFLSTTAFPSTMIFSSTMAFPSTHRLEHHLSTIIHFSRVLAGSNTQVENPIGLNIITLPSAIHFSQAPRVPFNLPKRSPALSSTKRPSRAPVISHKYHSI